jgi:hypothetical protein
MAVVKGAVDAVAAFGPRVSLVLKADIREGYAGELTAKVDRLESALAAGGATGGGAGSARPGNPPA